MIGLLINLLILCLILGLVWWVIGLIPLPDPFGLIVRVVFAVICVIILIDMLLSLGGGAGLLRPYGRL